MQLKCRFSVNVSMLFSSECSRQIYNKRNAPALDVTFYTSERKKEEEVKKIFVTNNNGIKQEKQRNNTEVGS